MSSHVQSSYAQQQQDQWNIDHQLRDSTLGTSSALHSHGLEALSAAALYHPPEANMTPQSMPPHKQSYNGHSDPSHPYTEHGVSSGSPSATISTSNNLNLLLNPASDMTSPIDPSLMSPEINQARPISNEGASAQEKSQGSRADGEPEPEHKVAYLLRHFSETPGQWSVK